jgi:flagellar assembly factor FliW
MQSLERRDLAFCLLAPFEAGLDPDLGIDPAVAAQIGAAEVGDIAVFTIVVLDRDPAKVCTNLRAPILVSRTTRQAMQAVIDDERLPVQAPVQALFASGRKDGAC